VFAQGKIGWGNSGTTRVKDVGGATDFTGQVGFYVSTDSGATFNLVASSVKPVSSGLFLGAPTSLTLLDGSSNPITAAVQYMVKAWSTGFTSYEAALAGADGTTIKGGISTVGTIDPTNLSTDPTPSLVINGGFAGLTVSILPAVPEPSTYALMVLGLGGLLFIRRRK
jgi:hypothetical protein